MFRRLNSLEFSMTRIPSNQLISDYFISSETDFMNQLLLIVLSALYSLKYFNIKTLVQGMNFDL